MSYKVDVLALPAPKDSFPKLIDAYALALYLGIPAQLLWYYVLNTDKSYYRFYIDKDTKEFVSAEDAETSSRRLRPIDAPQKALKDIQSRILDLLSPLPKHEANFAYMKGKNIRKAMEEHLDGDLLVRVDLTNFFGDTHEPFIRWQLRELTGFPKEVCGVLARLATLNGSMPQGAVTSPFLSIVLNEDMDKKITNLSLAAGLKYTRYADDLLFSGSDMSDTAAWNFIRSLKGALHPFKINYDKVAIMRNAQHRMHIGWKVAYHNDTQLKALEDFAFHKTVTPRYVKFSGDDYGSYLGAIQSIEGVIVRPLYYYIQSIKRGLGLYLTPEVHYPSTKYEKMRVEAMLYGLDALSSSKRVTFEGTLNYIKSVDSGRHAKLLEVITKYKLRSNNIKERKEVTA